MKENEDDKKEKHREDIYEVNGIRKIKSNKPDLYILTLNDNYNVYLIQINVNKVNNDFQLGNKLILNKTITQRIPLKLKWKTIIYIQQYTIVTDNIISHPEIQAQHNEDDFTDINEPLPTIPSNERYNYLSDLTTFTKEFKIFVKITKLNKPQIIHTNEKTLKILNIIIQDQQGTEMLMNASEEHCEIVYSLLKENSFYIISGHHNIYPTKQFNPTNSQYYIKCNKHTLIKPIPSPTIPFPSPLPTNLTTISNIHNLDTSTFVNMIAYVSCLFPKSKSNKYKTIKLSDLSKYNIRFSFSEEFFHIQIQVGDVLLLKRLRIKKGEVYTLFTCHLSEIILNPEIEECYKLKEYFKSNMSNIKQISNAYDIKTPIYIRDFINNYLHCAKPNDLFGLQGCLEIVTEPDKMIYRGCPLERCYKRKVDINNNSYCCKNCKQTFRDVNYYFKLFVQIKDATQKVNVLFFEEQASKLIGISGNEFHELLFYGKDEQIKQIKENIQIGEYIVYCKIKYHLDNDNNINSYYKYNDKTIYVDSFTKISWK